MADTVRISKPHLEALLNAVEQFEEYTAKSTIAAVPNTQAFDAYLAARRPMLESLYEIKFALKFRVNPEIVEA